MFRLWCKLFDNSNHMIKDMVAVNDDPELNRTRKIFDGIKEACYEFDLSEPLLLPVQGRPFPMQAAPRLISPK